MAIRFKKRGHTSTANLKYILGGFNTVTLMITLEILTGHRPFETAIHFFKYNINAHVISPSYGSMPWFTYFGILSLVFIPPLSIILLKPFFKASLKLKLPLGIFLVVLIPHLFLTYKLERFIIPILPIYMLITIYGVQHTTQTKFYKKIFYLFLLLNVPLTLLVTMSGSQLGSTSGLIALQKQKGKKFIRGVHPIWWEYYGYDKTRPKVENKISNIIHDVEKEKILSFHLLNFLFLSSKDKNKFLSYNISCSQKNIFSPSFGEKIVIWLNPLFNQRRREVTLYHCLKKNQK